MNSTNAMAILGFKDRSKLFYYKNNGTIRAEKIGGRFDYADEDVYKLAKLLNDSVNVIDSSPDNKTSVELTPDKESKCDEELVKTVTEGLDIIRDFFFWMNKINFMSTEYGDKLAEVVSKLKSYV